MNGNLHSTTFIFEIYSDKQNSDFEDRFEEVRCLCFWISILESSSCKSTNIVNYILDFKSPDLNSQGSKNKESDSSEIIKSIIQSLSHCTVVWKQDTATPWTNDESDENNCANSKFEAQCMIEVVAGGMIKVVFINLCSSSH